jgi:drug/metabolite transporter (DMT)-like permease
MLGAALAMAVGTVLCRYACRNTDALVVTGWHLVIGSVPLLGESLQPLQWLGAALALVSVPLWWWLLRGPLGS